MSLDAIAGRLFDRVTNPALSNKQKADYISRQMEVMHFVADRFALTIDEVCDMVVQKEDALDASAILHEEDDLDQSIEAKVFWAFIDEMEIHDR